VFASAPPERSTPLYCGDVWRRSRNGWDGSKLGAFKIKSNTLGEYFLAGLARLMMVRDLRNIRK
jgi:hypothetical protein